MSDRYLKSVLRGLSTEAINLIDEAIEEEGFARKLKRRLDELCGDAPRVALKPKRVESTSGGLTSMMLAALEKEKYGNTHDITYIFANTGCENEETLEFVDACDRYFNLGIVWVEAVINPEHGKGVTHRRTSFKSAYRWHDYKDPNHPFHAHIAKSGIPNANKPQCSDRLKEFAIEHFKKVNGLSGCEHALGIRADEKRRVMSKKVRDIVEGLGLDGDGWRLTKSHDDRCAMIDLMAFLARDVYAEKDLTKMVEVAKRYSGKLHKYGLVYPLCDDYNLDKIDVKDFWEDMPFTLQLEDHEGNCQTCWKKSDKKIHLLAIEHPERFEAFDWWEKNYQHVKPNTDGNPRVFFRKHRSCEIIFKEASLFSAATLRKLIGAEVSDISDGCAESCNGYSMD